MNKERYNRLRELFLAAHERQDGERAAFLDQACGGDRELRAQIEELLASHDDASQFLETPALGAGFDAASSEILGNSRGSPRALGDLVDLPSNAPGVHGPLPERIGRYRVLELLGQGGMGVVYLAEQESPRRTVALKVIQPGRTSPDRLKRFEYEAQVLGRLQHPGIAQIHEAGMSDYGFGPQPFFAMELVRGVPLTTYAVEHRLPTRERLALFVRVCEAVQHAHQHGVIHRDLKPQNILVDATGQPKILDFGVARTTDGDVQLTTVRTGIGQLIGTLPYMSPEQVAGDSEKLDSRSDVYALGIVLYELLAGSKPYDLERRSIAEAARMIAEGDPTPITAHGRYFRGDIETIVSKALEKDRDRRYASASALASDVERHLHDEPIAARPASTIYQVRKFARRNKLLVGGLASVFTALALGIAGTAWQAKHATEQKVDAERARGVAQDKEKAAIAAEALAQREARSSRAALDFVRKMFGSLDPDQEGVDVTVRRLLENTRGELGDTWSGDPAVGGVVLSILGQGFRSLGLWQPAEELMARAVPLLEKGYGPADSSTVQALSDRGYFLILSHRYAEAGAVLELALERWAQIPSDRRQGAIPRWEIESNQALLLEETGQLERALEIVRRLSATLCESLGPEHRICFGARLRLAKLHDRLHQIAEAREILEELVEDLRAILGDEHSLTLGAKSNLGCLLVQEGRPEEALSILEEVLDVQLERFGEQHTDTYLALSNVAWAKQGAGDLEGSAEVLERALELMDQGLRPSDLRRINALNNLATVREGQGLLDQAEQVYRRALDALEVSPPEKESLPTLTARVNYALLLLVKQGRTEEAGVVIEKALAAARERLDPAHYYHARLKSVQGRYLTALGRFEEAERLLGEAVTELEQRPGDFTSYLAFCRYGLVDLYTRWEKPEMAEVERTKLGALKAARAEK